MKNKFLLLMVVGIVFFASCSDDDSGIQLTEDEVFGDIITGSSTRAYGNRK